jgi:hypothetical protein
MAGQGRNADGLAGSQPPDALNVVRFPGDWFGPLGDLVPIDIGSERDEQAAYADDPARVAPLIYADELAEVAADAFWGEDAQDVHRVRSHEPPPKPAAQARPVRRSGPPRRLVLPVVGAALAALLVTAIFSSGATVTEPKRVSLDPPPQSPVTQLATASPSKETIRQVRLAESAATDQAAADKRRTGRHATNHSSSKAARLHHPSVSAAARPPGETLVSPRQTVVAATDNNVPGTENDVAGTENDVAGTRRVGGKVKTQVAANASTGEVASPTGVVSPPPNATQPNP